MNEVKFTDGISRRVMTRWEVIQAWVNLSFLTKPKSELEKLCCPCCRDLLYQDDNGLYYCNNEGCNMPGEDGAEK